MGGRDWLPPRNGMISTRSVMGHDIVYVRNCEQVQADIDRLNPAVREFKR